MAIFTWLLELARACFCFVFCFCFSLTLVGVMDEGWTNDPWGWTLHRWLWILYFGRRQLFDSFPPYGRFPSNLDISFESRIWVYWTRYVWIGIAARLCVCARLQRTHWLQRWFPPNNWTKTWALERDNVRTSERPNVRTRTVHLIHPLRLVFLFLFLPFSLFPCFFLFLPLFDLNQACNFL